MLRPLRARHARIPLAIAQADPHARLAEAVRQERQTVDEAYPGDIIGIINSGALGIGDTLTSDPAITYAAIPRFEPEQFARLRNRDVLRSKQFTRGLGQLEQEAAVQVLWEGGGARSAPLLAAVGDLQFEVVIRRLVDEYGAETVFDHLTHQALRVVTGTGEGIRWPNGALQLTDHDRRSMILLGSTREAEYFRETYPAARLRRVSDV